MIVVGVDLERDQRTVGGEHRVDREQELPDPARLYVAQRHGLNYRAWMPT